ncbi:hypothetical protein C5167_009689 [Papaver somniferum]|uniref:Uncharacterized protein n=1 Tax=Papaver somniferum TaxID=3469 RepID=A0A4Y7JY29_PAPSO|nr:hypothetical protein C5167_009689 [Papaver somniferum]
MQASRIATIDLKKLKDAAKVDKIIEAVSKLVPLGFTGASQLHAERQEGITVDHEAFNKGGIKEKQCTLIRRALPGHKDLQITGRFVLNGAYVLENVVYAGAHQSKLLLEPAQKMVETGYVTLLYWITFS